MRTKFALLFVLLAFVSSAQALETGSPPVLAPVEDQAKAAHLSAQILSHYHYKKVPLDDALSAKIISRYIESLDPERFFSCSPISISSWPVGIRSMMPFTATI